MADFFPGDIIKSINDIEIFNVDSILDAITTNQGQSVSIVIIRDGELLTKIVNLN